MAMKRGYLPLCLAALVATSGNLWGQEIDPTAPDWRDPYDSGGPLIAEQAAFDVTYYDLALTVDPSDSTIAGTLSMHARMVAPAEVVALDLDTLLTIESISRSESEGEAGLPFRRSGSRVFVELPFTKQPGDELRLTVQYGGRPRVAPRPPWDGGVQWAMTPSGFPWVATSNQMIGADVWWPNKDHVSDKPDSMAIHITVPEPLVVASNGRLEEIEEHGDGTRTYHWFVSTPISGYNVALNIAPYEMLEEEYESVTGETFPVTFWVLPESVAQGRALMPEILAHLRWFEETVGPYPFRADKYGVAQTPHLGMEHQSIIAYGANFDNRSMTGGVDWGFDALHHHELAHEWWGNLITNADWKDMWIHEGFGSYMQALWLEDTQGIARYHEFMANIRPLIGNRAPAAPRHSLSAQDVYGTDIYFKGAWVLHTLRHLVGGNALREALRRMAYPTETAARTTDGSHVRFVSTADVITVFEDVSGRDLDWFFEVYLRRAPVPRLRADLVRSAEADRQVLSLRWEVPDDLPFPMPVDVYVDGSRRRIELPHGQANVDLPADARIAVDPRNRILREPLGDPLPRDPGDD
jgi:aminopeptidase N